MPPNEGALRNWWPTTQSLDLVEGPVRAVAEAVHAEYLRFTAGERLEAGWVQFQDLEAAFRSAPYFSSVPTVSVVLPTRSNWTVLWNNSFLCNGYDSLCSNLTSGHGLRTMHWSAHDESTTFQAGTHFIHRRRDGANTIKRTVQSAKQDKRWHFYAIGEPLPEEHGAEYDAKRKRDRMNEENLMALLGRLGARPWSEDFYALPEQECLLIRRPSAPSTVARRAREEVLR